MMRCEVPLARRLALALGSFVLLAGAVAAAQEVPSQAPQVPHLLRLTDAIAIALETSNQLGIEHAQLDAARKQHLSSWFDLGPDLSVDGSYAKSRRTDYDVSSEQATALGTLVTVEGDTLVTPVASRTVVADRVEDSSFKQVSGSASIRLFDGLANLGRIAATGHDVNAQEHTVEYTRQLVTESVIQTYYNLLRAKLLLGVAEEAERVAADQLERTKALYELGSAARSDVLKQQVQHDNTRLDLVKAQQLQKQAYVDLTWAMNLETTTPFEIDTTVSRINFETQDFDSQRDFALMHRQNLLSSREAETAADRRVWVARGPLFPSLDFQYSMSATRTTSQFRFGAADNTNRSWGFFARWNVWDRYNTYAAIGQAKANARVAEYQRRQSELDAIREIRGLVDTMDEAKERVSVSRQTVESASEDLRLAQERFRVGAGTILDTVVAQADLTSARANVVQAIVDYLIARAKLARATGRPLGEV
jgi:outer membrane protein